MREFDEQVAWWAVALAHAVDKAFRDDDAGAIRLFGSNGPHHAARAVLREDALRRGRDATDVYLEMPTDPAVAFALEHALRGAADTIARRALGATVGEGEEFSRDHLSVATSRVYEELSYRIRHIAPHLPGSWRRLERELGDRAGEAFLLRTLERPSGASLHVVRDGNGRVASAWVEPAPLLELPPRLPQNA